MSAAILEASKTIPVIRGTGERNPEELSLEERNLAERNLALLRGKLARLRDQIVFAANGRAGAGPDAARRRIGRGLKLVRKEYEALIDEIAMSFGVQAAIDAVGAAVRNAKSPAEHPAGRSRI